MLRMLLCCPTHGHFDIEKANSGPGVWGLMVKWVKEKKKMADSHLLEYWDKDTPVVNGDKSCSWTLEMAFEL